MWWGGKEARRMRTGWLTGILLAAAVALVLAVPSLRREVISQVTTPLAYRFVGSPPLRKVKRVVEGHPSNPEMWLGYAGSIKGTNADVMGLGWACGTDWWDRMDMMQTLRLMGGQGVSRARGAGWWERRLEQAPHWEKKAVQEVCWHAWPRALLRRIEAPEERAERKALEKARALAPESAAIGLRYALWLLDKTGSPSAAEDDRHPPQRSLEEMRNLREAREVLKQCRGQDRDNAACDYLLAWTYLAERKDDEALGALRGAAGKRQWNTYQREFYRAILRVWDEIESPVGDHVPAQTASFLVYEWGIYGRLRSLARRVAALGNELRAQGEHEQAILCYEAVARLGNLLRKHAYTQIDGLVGLAISGIAAAPFLSQAEAARIHAAVSGSTARIERRTQARTRNSCAYVREHGRDDLAAFYARDMAEGERWRRDFRRVRDEQEKWEAITSNVNALVVSGWIWMVTGAMLGVGVMVWALSLMLGGAGQERQAASWGYLQWLALLALLTAPALVLVCLPIGSLSLTDSMYWGNVILIGGLGVCVVMAVWLLLVRVLGEGGPYLACLRTLVPPTVAALILMSVVALWVVRARADSYDAKCREIWTQGEAKYWGIGRDGQSER